MQIFRYEAKQLIAYTYSKHIIFNIFLKDGWDNATRKDVGNRFTRGEVTRHLHLPFAITGTVFEKHNIIKRVELEVKYSRLKRMQRGFLENTIWILCLVSVPKPLITVTKIAKKKKTAKILLLFLFGQHATTTATTVLQDRSRLVTNLRVSLLPTSALYQLLTFFFFNSQARVIRGQSYSCAKAQRTFLINGVWA